MGSKSSTLKSKSNLVSKVSIFNQIPEPILFEIKEYLVPTSSNTFFSEKSLLRIGSQLLSLQLSLRLQVELPDMKTRFQLLSKYWKYNTDYEWYYTYQYKKKEQTNLIGHPILLDILFTGCPLPCANTSHDFFNDSMEEDLKSCIDLFPGCLNSTFGSLRCRYNVSPLHAACSNDMIPLRVIDYLIKQGADMNHPISVNGEPIHILEDLEDNRNYRLESIRKIFNKYSSETSKLL